MVKPSAHKLGNSGYDTVVYNIFIIVRQGCCCKNNAQYDMYLNVDLRMQKQGIAIAD